jgi:hypothetical protein
VWCDILVQQPVVNISQERPSSLLDSVYEEKPEKVEMIPAVSDLKMSVFEEIQVEQPKEVIQELPKQEEKKDEDIYQVKLAAIKDSKLAQALKDMAECGYNNFELNMQLLMRNNCDVVIAINKLCNGLVSESMFE